MRRLHAALTYLVPASTILSISLILVGGLMFIGIFHDQPFLDVLTAHPIPSSMQLFIMQFHYSFWLSMAEACLGCGLLALVAGHGLRLVLLGIQFIYVEEWIISLACCLAFCMIVASFLL